MNTVYSCSFGYNRKSAVVNKLIDNTIIHKVILFIPSAPSPLPPELHETVAVGFCV